ncbi:NarK/NasA family nitrate transporter [Baekduia soli]|uniref:NarK/NasA family nitrate transporter n=1 Tax=Baekduia soli TaxID=496014 RepID=A0A5B8U6T7_9ACTN|nr:MFS transporter [Baekduia soli]QEC48804.1 NarK/NasA family nitrate transporter [Baekduia soli]
MCALSSQVRPARSVPGARARPETAHATRALILATFAFTACFYAWSIIGPLSPTLQKHLQLSEFQTAAMVAVPVLLGSILRVPLGILADIYGGRRVFSALMAFSIVPVAALAVWHDALATVIALGLLLGVAGASFAVGVVFVNGWYPPERRGFALGVYGMGMGGTVLAALTAPRIAKPLGLQAPFIVAAGVLVVATVIFASMARDAAKPAPRTGRVSLVAPLAIFRTSARAWALTLFYFLSFGGFVAMFLYLPKLLVGVYGLSKIDAGSRAAGFALLAVLGRPVGGLLADRLDPKHVLRVSFIATGVLAVLLGFSYKHMVPLTAECLTLGVVLGLGTGAVFKLVAQWFPDQVGAVTGVVGAAGGLGGFFPPLVMAMVKSATGSYTIGFLLLAAVAAVALSVVSRVRGDAR